jgi:biotin carboxylase
VDGPIHAELRVRAGQAWVIEVAARSIGGLCSRTLRFGTGLSLEELILRHALGEGVDALARETRAAGVMMIPIPRAGVLERVEGVEDAEAVPGVDAVTISAHPGQTLVPLPEGSRYLGFLFARGETPDGVESALRRAHAALRFRIEPR